MERRIIEAIANDQKPDWRMNLLHEFAFLETSDRNMSSPHGQIAFEIRKEPFIRALDEDVDLAGATKSPSGIEAHECWLASSQNVARASRYFLFNTPGAQ